MMIYYCLSFLISEVWLDLRNNILFRDYSIFCTYGRLPIIGLWAKRVGPSFCVGTKRLECWRKKARMLPWACFSFWGLASGPECLVVLASFLGMASFLGLTSGPVSLIFRTLSITKTNEKIESWTHN